MHDIRSLLILSTVPRIGPVKIRALVSHFGSSADVLKATARELIQVPGIDKKLASNIVHRKDADRFADDQLKRLNKVDGRIVTIWDKEYPELLKRIYDPPVLLFVLGKFSPHDKYSIAMVGTRHPTGYGQAVSESLSERLVRIGVAVVSGLARGVDTIVHSTVVKLGGRTIAVIGSGLDVPYPPENRKLLERIAEDGVVVSEFSMGAKPDATNFPRRNRIISGLSLGTVIIESAEDGGAMITASTALDQNREVFAVPGAITEKRSAGTNRLIRDGRAKLISSVEDILVDLEVQLKPILKGMHVVQPTVELNLFEQKIFDLLNSSPIHIDTLAELASATTSDALVALLGLEFKGLVKQLPGKLFIKA
ncbi:MAG: DNA-protecting protein DprA [Ignavibacteriales bacterium]|nr:DNA-protecting protein DprA [Ignavibacteriales bacterium]